MHLSPFWLLRTALVACVSLSIFAVPSEAEPLLKAGDRIAYCGDGPTSDLGYTVYMTDYLLCCAQVPDLVPAEFGWSASNPNDFLARVNTDLAPFKPTVVTINYSSGDPNNRAASETKLIDAIKKLGVRTIVLGSPACVGPEFDKDPAKVASTNQALAALAQIDKEVAAKEGIVFADVYGATQAMLQKADEKFGPNHVGNRDGLALTTAYAFLKALQVDGNIAKVTIDFTPDFKIGKAEASEGQKVLSVDEQTLKLEGTRYTFAFPGYPCGDPNPYPIHTCVPFDAELNKFVVVIKNLPSPRAKIFFNDQANQHDYTREELEKGVNLMETMPSPFGKFQNVDGADRGLMQDERVAGSAMVQGKPDAKAQAAADGDLAIAKSRLGPVQYTIRIQPLSEREEKPKAPVNVVFDTDMDSDFDDAVALTLLNDFMCQGECNILACNVNTHNTEKTSGATVQAINAYYGHPNIPIGAAYGADEPVCGSGYTTQIKNQFAPNFPPDDKLPKGFEVYRKALVSAPDNSVVICSVGSMGNITDLLKSAPDDISPLAGPDLVKKKVRQMVIMANTNKNDVFVIKNWPTPILWTTDIGNYIYPGKSVLNTPMTNPLHAIFNILKVDSRQGWDPTAVWLSVRGTGDVYDKAIGGYWRVNVPPLEWGTWVVGPVTNHSMATVNMPSDQVLKLYNDELARPPK
jgi:hypothetical protein